MKDANNHQMVDSNKAAEILGYSPATLVSLRSRGTGCPYYTTAGRISYDVRDLDVYRTDRVIGGKNNRNIYEVAVYRGGKFVTTVRRAARTLGEAVEIIEHYPSFKGCKFSDKTPVKAEAVLGERLRTEFRRAKPEIKDAIRRSVTGESASVRKTANRAADRILEKVLRRAMK